MTTKATGAELKRFYNDPAYWPGDQGNTWHEDEIVLVDGKTVEEYADVADDAKVTIDGGVVLSSRWDEEEAPSFETHFKRWRKAQSTAFLSVECPKDKLEAVKAAIRAAGGKVA
jgi:hypothetical protein